MDPRLARMVLEADQNGCVREVMVIAAALSIQDPRERPSEKQAQADQQHARFKDETSDFLAYLNLWRYVREQQKERGSSSFRRMCKQEYLNFLRIREWQDIYSQLRTVAKTMGIHLNEEDAPEQSVAHLAAGRVCSRTSASRTPRRTSTWAPAAPSSRSSRARRCSRSSPSS